MSDGIPAPNPGYPQQIKNVTGNANIKIQNKNLFDYQFASDYSNTTVSSYRFVKIADVVKGQQYNINNLDVSNIENETSLYIYITSKPNYEGITSGNSLCYGSNKLYTTNISLNAPTTNSYYIGIYPSNINETTFNKILDKFKNAQLEQGTTATSYVPHQEQNLPVTLGNIELCKIVNYQDYFYKENGKWYLHKEILKKVYNGTENWELNGTYNCPSIRFGEVLNKKAENSLSNYFIEKSAQLLATEYGMYTKYSGILFVGFPNATITEFKTCLSIHNLILYIGTDTPINTEITDTTLIEQLEATLQAKSYDDITYISSTSDEEGFDMKVTAYKEISKMKQFI